ncbi:STY4534 family ICE replication protein [Thioalkalivibrio sp. ALE20]|uniref:STY4534 family ICE replication protein n=1 Tax=Thioalkalivibrio sp. ALE20 TaxID=545275 RepID=UPI00036D65B3|nr:STY4534 family ICE replication protein [Thioalkalivibrio sp. ALE20]
MSENKFFDLHINGIGYVNRIREVRPKKGQPFWACDIVALHGDREAPEKTRFDCRVSGEQAERLIRRCKEYVEQDQKVLIGFKLGDLYPETFVYKQGSKAGETGVSLKARLLRIGWIKIDGETVYTAERTTQENPEETTSE